MTYEYSTIVRASAVDSYALSGLSNPEASTLYFTRLDGWSRRLRAPLTGIRVVGGR